MTSIKPSNKYSTHEVTNQPPPLVNYNLFTTDGALKDAVKREGGDWGTDRLIKLGQLAGSEEVIEAGFQANRFPPILKTFDRFGHRIDEVEFHPAWHKLMGLSVEHELHCLPWKEPREGAHVTRAAMMFIMSQVENGHGCPISMTYSVVPALRVQANLAKIWEPRICSSQYDSRCMPASEKNGAIFGMGMTEKQGGSDVRANTTRAVPIDGTAGEYAITGHKWFCSAPMSDAFLILAQAPGGLSCFLLPRWTPDGERNRFFIQRLKDKLGNKSNASSEVEFDHAYAVIVGEEGRGARTIIEMVNHTRLDCSISSSAIMRQALLQAIHHCSFRSAFGKRLIDHPLMRNVLADLTIESEAATTLTFRLAGAYDRANESPEESAFRRIATAVSKYWLCKRTPIMVSEAIECLGGAGYVEESIMPRLYREAPLNSIWEGSGNVICLDVLRAINKEPQALEALINEIDLARGNNKTFDTFCDDLQKQFKRNNDLEPQARMLVEKLALALQGSLLLRLAPPAIADAFCASRLTGDWGHAFGTLSSDVPFDAIIERAAAQK
jgi:putative acyl-CoA dehydrogenase